MTTTDDSERAHLWLAKSVGTWDVEARYYVAPGADPIEASGVEEVEMFGRYWRRGHLQIELPGSTVHGLSCVGFDPLKQVFISTWIDTSNPYLYSYRGVAVDDERLVLDGINTDPVTGKQATYRSVEVFDLPERRTLELFIEAPGRPEAQIFTYELTRRK